MDCSRIETLLGPLLDAELGPEETRAVRAHLESCPRCRSRLETLRALRAAVRDLRPGRSEAGLEAVLARVRRDEGGDVPRERAPSTGLGDVAPWSRRRALRLAAGIAAGVALTVAGAIWIAVERGPAPVGPPETPPPAAPAETLPSACLRPEDCGPEAVPLWPPIAI